MALIECKECGKKVSDKAQSCPNCGNPIAATNQKVMIRFPIFKNQMLNNKCLVYDSDTDEVIASCRQGETVSFECDGPRNIYVVARSCFGRPSATVEPGDKYDVGFRGFGKIYLSKVDAITGNPNSSEFKGPDVSVGIFGSF